MTKAAELAKMGEVLTNSQIGGRRNIIINGAMQVNQRNSSTTSDNAYNTDRFIQEKDGGTCTYSWEALSSGSPYDEGFRYFSRLTNTATASGVAEYRQLSQRLESQDISKSGWNYTSTDSYITVSFWIRSSVAGKYTFTLLTHDGTPQIYNFSRTLVADTWTKVTEAIPGNANLQFDNNEANGLTLHFRVWLGSNYTSATSEDAWATYLSSVISESGIANWAGTTNATYDVTGVQLEVGSQATPFEHRSFGEELALCQRYFFRSGKGESPYAAFAQGWATNTTSGIAHVAFPVEMRAEPSFSSSNIQASDDANAGLSITSAVTNVAVGQRMYGYLEWTVSSGATQYRGYSIRGNNNTSAFIAYDAEL